MIKGRCDFCSSEETHYYDKKSLCLYHYWIAKGRPLHDGLVEGQIEYFRYRHPILMKRWTRMDRVFADYVSSIPKRRRGRF